MTETMPMPIPKLDGHVAGKLGLAFSGALELDRADDHLQLLEALRLGEDIDLVVTLRVAHKGFTHAVRIGHDGEEDSVGYAVKAKVIDVKGVG